MSNALACDEDCLGRLPLPLAQLYRRAHNAKTPLDRHLTAYYLWEATLKLLASAAVVEYAERGRHEAGLAECLQNLARPSIGHWWEFVRRLLPVLADDGDGPFASLRDLVLGRARDDLPRTAGLDAALAEALDGRGGARSSVRLTELFDRLVRYRNREVGHGAAGQRPAEFYERMGRALLAGLAELLGRLDALAGRRLLYIPEVRRQASGEWLVERYELIGETGRRMESLALPESEALRRLLPERVYLEGSSAATARDQTNPALHALHPLVVYDPAGGDVLFLNARRGLRRTEYLCYRSGDVSERRDLGREQRALLARVLGLPVEDGQVEQWGEQAELKEQAAGPPAAEEATGTPSRRLGEFELLSELGRGGMGVVYRAWQPSLGRQVALKCLFQSGDPRAEARFAREIRALGHVEHPHLVKIFTSGADGEQWFYAMELVEGALLSSVYGNLQSRGPGAGEVDLSTWEEAVATVCDESHKAEKPLSGSGSHGAQRHRAPVDAGAALPRHPPPVGRSYVRHVAGLIRQVAEAAHALHEAGVIHRDIKPSNILVTADSSQAVLMDLGLAQLADESDGRLTRTRQFVGTLRYASPEQVDAVARLDRRSDVYSLGATLWELLTLRPLFGATEQTPTPEVIHRIQRTDAVPVRRYNTAVSADLEAIILKCLEKDAGRRYASARDLARDLERYQAGEPVRARPISGLQRGWRWCRRKPALAGLLMALVVVILGSLAGLTVLYLSAERARRVAEHREAEARAVTRFYEEHVLAAARPKGWEGGAGKDVTLKEALDQAAPQIDDAFAGQPEVEATVRNTLGMTYFYLGQFEAANTHLEKAYALRLDRLGPDHPDTLTSLHNLAMLRWKQEKLREAIALGRQALERRRRVLGPEHQDTLWTQLNLGLFLEEEHEYGEAEKLLRQAIESCKRTLGPDHHHTLYGQSDLALVLWWEGKKEESLALDRQTLEGRRRSLGSDHPDTLRSMDNLAGSLKTTGQLEEAEGLCRQAFEARRRVLGEAHEETFWGLGQLTDILLVRAKLAEAEVLFRQKIEICRRLHGSDDPGTIQSQAALGVFLWDQGKLQEAGQLLQQAMEKSQQTVEGSRRRLGPEDPLTLEQQNHFAWLLETMGKAKEAEALYRQTLETQRRVRGPLHKDTLNTATNLAVFLSNQGKKMEAEGLCSEIMELPRLAQDPAYRETPFDGNWHGKWENHSSQTGADSLRIIEQADGTFTGVWSGYVRVRGERLGGSTFVLQGVTGTRFYRLVGSVGDGKVQMKYSAFPLNFSGEMYSGWCTFTKSN